jgi:type IV secretory pathway VirB10-like protein
MSERSIRPTIQGNGALPPKRSSWSKLLLGVAAGLMVIAGVYLSFIGPRQKISTESPASAAASDHTQSSVFSSGRRIKSPEAPPPVSPARSTVADNKGAAPAGPSPEVLAQQAAAQEASRLEAEQLAAKQKELDQIAADQEAKAKKITEDAALLQAENDRLARERLEANKAAEQAAAAAKATPVYSGPSSGTLVWQGEVKGTTLLTINGSQPDQGHIVSGALPGVLVLLQPADAKHVVVASSPSPSNGFQRLTLRIQGNGLVQQTIHWSLP